jgi:MOSC domain-containing protein YiiM
VKLISVNVGLPREVEFDGETVLTSIFKSPVSGRVRVSQLNLEGDKQSDLTVHGGRDKAVYVYPSEHYASWRKELPDADLGWGAFGENLTTKGLLEDRVAIGDRLRCGSAAFEVTQPRLPCYKLGIRFGRTDIIKRFMQSGRCGFYLAVVHTGDLAEGDDVELIPSEHDRVTVAEIFSLFQSNGVDLKLLRRASRLPAMPETWRERFRARLEELEG